MIRLDDDELSISFPEVHCDAVLHIDFQRTLRIPDDDRTYALPPGLGRFPLRRIDDFATVPDAWKTRGGVMMPIYQSEALWIRFHSPNDYPFAMKVATGKINAITGEPWDEPLHRGPQDYVVIPEQPWLDGYCVEKGIIRQFVAMPLGSGATVEEQVTGEAEHGGLQFIIYPIRPEAYERIRAVRSHLLREPDVAFCAASPVMGLAAGGRMRQQIYKDPYPFHDWDTQHSHRCFVHLVNATAWQPLTGEAAPPTPCTVEAYVRAGLPWFEYYNADLAVLGGSVVLRGVKSLGQVSEGVF